MAVLNWNSIGIDVGKHSKPVEDINQHNATILAKLDTFAEIIQTSRLDDKDFYLNVLQENYDLLKIITLYHDVGKVRDKLNHGEHSYDILRATSVLEILDLDPTDQALVGLIIRHHLVLGTLLTGEWPVKKLRLTQEDIQGRVPPDVFYSLLVLFSVLDTWAYVNNTAYATRLLYNYDRIAQRFRQESWTNHIKTHHFWRFCCFLGAWRHTDYQDETSMQAYEDRLIYLIGQDRQSLWQQYRQLSDVNLNYAIWLLGNCCFDADDLYRTARLGDIHIHDSLFMILDDIVNTLTVIDTSQGVDVLFNGYRDPRTKAMRTFQRLREEPACLSDVLEHRHLDAQHRRLVYDFGMILS